MTPPEVRAPIAPLLVLAGAAALLSSPHTAYAAVSECFPVLEGRTAEADSELEARKAAMQDWLDKARKIGPEYTRWQLAYNRQLTCQRTTAGAHQCRAVGMPCAIKQVPTQGLERLKRGVPPQ